ncbi:MAG: C25 family cysteine peptidase, partial [bacterium]
LEYSFRQLFDLKIAKVLSATCVTVEWIDGNYDGEDIQAKVRNFIRDAYQNWGTNWVLLGGDTNIIPSRTVYAMDCEMGGVAGNRIRCDLYFADLDGTWNANGVSPYGEVSDSVDMYPEVFVGRAPVENYVEAEVFVEKVITYEKDPPLDYALKMLMLGEILWTSPYTDAGIGLDMIDEDYIPPRFDPITKLYESKGNESRESVLAAMSEGTHLVFHDGHCNEYVMGVGDGYIYYTDADTLSNGNQLLVLNSIGCWPAAIDRDCIAEHFINDPNGGAVAFIGNSRYGWGSPGNPGLGYSDKFQHEFARAVFKDSLLHIGEAFASSKIVFVPLAQDENVYRWNEYQLNLLGDPEMALWTDEPRILSLNLPDAVISGGILRVQVSDSEGAVASASVTVTNGDDYYEAGLTDLSGSVVFEINTSSHDSLLVTATSFNYRCATAKVEVIHEGILPSWKTLKVVDSNDSLANPGETIDIRIGVTNFGTETAYGVIGYLRNLRNCIVNDSTCYYGNLIPKIEVFGESDFRITVDGDTENGDLVELELTLVDAHSDSWVMAIPIVIATPYFEATSHGINDVVWGDGDFIVEPAEDIDLTVEITNFGLTAAEATISLISLDPYIEVIDNLGSAGIVAPGSTGYSRHRISISDQCPLVHIGAVEATIGQPEFVFSDTIYIGIGELSYFDDFSNGEGLWEHTGTPDSWFLTSNRFHSDSLSWYFGDPSTYRYFNNASGSLISPQLIAGEDCKLSFWFWYDFTTYGTDGIHVVLHRNSYLDTLDFIGSGGALDDSGEPLNVVSRWVKWERSLNKVQPGDTIRVEFAFMSDGSETAEGIYIDDFMISCRAAVIAGIEGGSVLRSQFGFDVFPNPAGQRVEIGFADRVGEGQIRIYNAEGRLVRKIRKSYEEQVVFWDLDDQDGHKVASGVYFIIADGIEKDRIFGSSNRKVVITR